MKKNLLITLIAFFISWQTVHAQVTETFETATVGGSSFTNGAFTGNLTPSASFKVNNLNGNAGYLSSSNYAENTNANACSITSATCSTTGSITSGTSTTGSITSRTSITGSITLGTSITG